MKPRGVDLSLEQVIPNDFDVRLQQEVKYYKIHTIDSDSGADALQEDRRDARQTNPQPSSIPQDRSGIFPVTFLTLSEMDSHCDLYLSQEIYFFPDRKPRNAVFVRCKHHFRVIGIGYEENAKIFETKILLDWKFPPTFKKKHEFWQNQKSKGFCRVPSSD